MRRHFRLSRFIDQHGHRQHWLPDVLRAEDECYEELAVIADHFASLADGDAQGGAARTVTTPPQPAASRQGLGRRGQGGPRRRHR